jgi:hypothetical protein
MVAQAVQDDAAKREGAKAAQEIVVKFSDAGHAMDEALRTIAEQGHRLNTLLRQLHNATGAEFPSNEQLEVLGYSAVMTVLLQTPWSRRFRPMQPSQRRQFGPLFNGWVTVIQGRIQHLLAAANEDAA